jgi:hypothetical protein
MTLTPFNIIALTAVVVACMAFWIALALAVS